MNKVDGEDMPVNTSVPNVDGVDAMLFTTDKDEQFLNASFPIEITLSGIVIFVKEEQSQKAYPPIAVTSLGILISLNPTLIPKTFFQ